MKMNRNRCVRRFDILIKIGEEYRTQESARTAPIKEEEKEFR